jgi:hypothetical protein
VRNYSYVYIQYFDVAGVPVRSGGDDRHKNRYDSARYYDTIISFRTQYLNGPDSRCFTVTGIFFFSKRNHRHCVNTDRRWRSVYQ